MESTSINPRSVHHAEDGFVQLAGKRTIAIFDGTIALVQTLFHALRAFRIPGVAARQVVSRIILSQIYFTGFEALGLVSVIALFLGASIMIQTGLMAPAANGEMLGKILVAVVIRELAPLGTAIIVTGRSGTAIATELGSMKVNSEVLALSSLGIDPSRYIVLPRILGAVVSVLALIVYFSVVSIAGGYLISMLLLPSSGSFDAVRLGFASSLRFADLGLFLLKGTGLGLLVGWWCCHFGLEVKTSPTEVPQKASRAVVMTLLACVIFNTLVTALYYGMVGSPVQ